MICRISPRYSSSVLGSLHRNIARKNSLQAVIISERPDGNEAGMVAFYYDGHYGWFGHIVRIIGK